MPLNKARDIDTERLSARAYLGDGVYGGVDESGQVVLSVETGIEATDIIYLEPAVAHQVIAYLATQYGWRIQIDTKGKG